jgi:hypothetical protein
MGVRFQADWQRLGIGGKWAELGLGDDCSHADALAGS